jgi:hypothetical protein
VANAIMEWENMIGNMKLIGMSMHQWLDQTWMPCNDYAGEVVNG